MVKFELMPGSRLQNYLWFQRNPLGFILASRKVADVVSLYPSRNRPSFIVHHPDVVKEILVTKEKSFVKGRSSAVLKQTAGEGLLTSEGQLHDKQKRIMMPAFVRSNIESYTKTVIDLANSMLNDWQDKQTRNISHDITLLTLRIICKTMLDMDLQTEAERIGASVEQCIRHSAKRIKGGLQMVWLQRNR
ncbi:cytochrome P450 [Effusibacillus dendaii]|uniref:Cytochrome P450 n=1 Tax=Effusibacillus dendaii TaxID=2743772 RepID=A0A7I8DEJ0_9BACL|nr:cytochrome P450 [Effusibacillus dendaii]BCJ86960.1 hypothetical protein skT53_19450 [Effusibacillus dendaii]